MSRRTHRLAWLPAFLVGASAGIAAELAVALLLYTGPGLVRSLTVILAAAGLSLAVGLWTAPGPGEDLVDRLRRRWLLCLGAFLTAAVFAAAWSFPGLVEDGNLSQALGLVLLAAVPLYACGTVLGGMASMELHERRSRTAAAAVTGAGLGFVATGILLPRTPVPATLLIGCLILLSLGGMVFGTIVTDEDQPVVDVTPDALDSERGAPIP